MIDLSLIVTTLGRTAPLGRLLESLLDAEVRPREILIVDQNAEDILGPVLAPFADLPIRRLASPRGLSLGRNLGIAAAQGRLVAFPDDDCWYRPETLARVEETFAAFPDLGLLTGRTVDEAGETSLSVHLEASADIDRHNVFMAGTSSTIFVDRGLARTVGGFDETLGVGAPTPFQSGEETDFLLRCLAAGACAFYDRDLLVHHDQIPASPDATLSRTHRYAPGYGRVLRRHGFGSRYLAARLARASVSAALCLARGDVPGALQRRAWIAGTWRGFVAAP